MPEKVDDCVESVLDDNPDMDESQAWAICEAEMQADVADLEIATVDELGIDAEALDELAAESDWTAHDGVWVDEDAQHLVYDEAQVQPAEPPKRLVIETDHVSEEMVDGLRRRLNADVEVVDGEASAAPTDRQSAE